MLSWYKYKPSTGIPPQKRGPEKKKKKKRKEKKREREKRKKVYSSQL